MLSMPRTIAVDTILYIKFHLSVLQFLFVRDFSAEELCNLYEQPQDGLFIIYFDKKDGLIIS